MKMTLYKGYFITESLGLRFGVWFNYNNKNGKPINQVIKKIEALDYPEMKISKNCNHYVTIRNKHFKEK